MSKQQMLKAKCFTPLNTRAAEELWEGRRDEDDGAARGQTIRFGKISFEIDWCRNKKPVRKHRTGSSVNKDFRAGREKRNLRLPRESFRHHYCADLNRHRHQYCADLNCHRHHDYHHHRCLDGLAGSRSVPVLEQSWNVKALDNCGSVQNKSAAPSKNV